LGQVSKEGGKRGGPPLAWKKGEIVVNEEWRGGERGGRAGGTTLEEANKKIPSETGGWGDGNVTRSFRTGLVGLGEQMKSEAAKRINASTEPL